VTDSAGRGARKPAGGSGRSSSASRSGGSAGGSSSRTAGRSGSGAKPPPRTGRPPGNAGRPARTQQRAGEERTRELRAIPPPDGATASQLDPDVRRALRSLIPATADRVAAHLVATAGLLDSDPDAALQQARAARAFAPRIGVVREAAGLAAYAAGEWAEALAELRAERRLTGSAVHLPVMADCERGLGRPERALQMAGAGDLAMLDDAGRAEMLIVASGARQDLGQLDAAVVMLGDAVDRGRPRPWSPRLWYAYAEALLAAGRPAEARMWFEAVTEIDDGETDAEERLLSLEHPDAGGQGD